MKTLLTTVLLVSIAMSASCDMRSGTAKEEMEKFSGSPTPTISPTPTPTPINPADIVQVDTNQEGETLTVNGTKQNKTLVCEKFDQVMINASGSTVTITGVCRQIMVNGNGNQITADAAMDFTFNGSDNTLKYARYVNGRQPLITENQAGNTVDKIAFEPTKNSGSQNKNAK
jgi:Protein of unknown function (DUF3060).